MIASLAWRYIFSTQRDPFLIAVVRIAFIGIMLGVAALVVVLSVMRGFHKELLSSILQMESHVSIVPPLPEKSFAPSKNLLQALNQHPDITRIVPLVTGQAGIIVGNTLQGIQIRGVESCDLPHEPMMTSLQASSDQLTSLEPGTAVIGRTLAQNLNVRVGDSITLFLPKYTKTIMGPIPSALPIRIVGIAHTHFYATDTHTVLIDKSWYSSVLRLNPEHTQRLDLYLKNAEDMAAVFALLKNHRIDTTRILPWTHRYQSFIETLYVERVVMTIILSLIILVAGFNVISGLMMFVRDKRYDTALLRLIGWSSHQVMLLYMISGSFIALGGVFSGLILGVILCWNIEPIRHFIERIFQVDLFKEDMYMIGRVPADCTPELILSIASICIIVCLCALWFPARRATHSAPLDCLRYEK